MTDEQEVQLRSEVPARSPAARPFLGVRLGINPNSSGHGILWGAMFFLPMAVAGLTLASILDGELSRALDRFRGGPPPPPGESQAGDAAPGTTPQRSDNP